MLTLKKSAMKYKDSDGSMQDVGALVSANDTDQNGDEEWELLLDSTLEEEVASTSYLFENPQRKVRIIIDTAAADADTNFMPFTIKTGTTEAFNVFKLYPVALPTKKKTRLMIEVTWLGDKTFMVESGVVYNLNEGATTTPAFSANTTSYYNKVFIKPLDYTGAEMNDKITGFSCNTYATFAVGTRFRAWGVKL